MTPEITQLKAELETVSEFAERLLRVHELRSVDEAKAIVQQVRQFCKQTDFAPSTPSVIVTGPHIGNKPDTIVAHEA